MLTAAFKISQHWCCQFYCCIQISIELTQPVLLLYPDLHSTDVASFTAVSKFPQHWYCCTGCTGVVWVIQYMHLTAYKERLHETYNTWQRKKKKTKNTHQEWVNLPHCLTQPILDHIHLRRLETWWMWRFQNSESTSFALISDLLHPPSWNREGKTWNWNVRYNSKHSGQSC